MTLSRRWDNAFHGIEMRTSWFVASAFVLISSSIQAASPVAGLNDNPSSRLLFALDPFAEPIGYSILEGDAMEKILRRFGKPLEENVSTVPTRFPGETFTTYFFRFEDVAFSVGKWPDRGHSWIETIEIDGNAHRLKSGVRIGSSREQIIAIFSPPKFFAKANPMWINASIFEKQDDVGEDGITPQTDGAVFRITFEFDADDRVSRVSVSTSGH